MHCKNTKFNSWSYVSSDSYDSLARGNMLCFILWFLNGSATRSNAIISQEDNQK